MRIPLSRLIKALTPETEASSDDAIILSGPVYFLMVDGEVNAIFDVNQYEIFGKPDGKIYQYLKSHRISPMYADE